MFVERRQSVRCGMAICLPTGRGLRGDGRGRPKVGNRLEGKVALVTGGGGGIGEATARLYWEEGAQVMIVDLDGDAADRAAAGIDPSGDRIGAIAADLTNEPEAERAVRETVARFGRLDVLANVAAV